jgi:Helicase associated domain.
VKKRDDRTVVTTATAKENETGDVVSTSNGQGRFRDFHEKKWNEHLKDLCEFKEQHGHCLVPHTFPENQSLARWVKRQRRQYKLMQDGDPSSTMTQDRVELLNREGFVWDSHEVVWRERYEQLLRYKEKHGHCRVPSYCKENPQLATWVKCQRRQYKLFWEGKRSSMSAERTQLLEDIGFVWEVRSDKGLHDKDDSLKTLADILKEL